MNTKGANLLLSTTLLIASCVATPSFAADTDSAAAAPETTDVKVKDVAKDAKAASTSEVAKEPEEPSAEDTKKIGQDRGIIITEIGKPAKPAAKASTAEIKGKPVGTIKRVSTAGNQTFTRGLVIDTKKETPKEQPDHSLLIKPPSKAIVQTKATKSPTSEKKPAVVKTTKTPVSATPVVIKSSPEPLKVKTHNETAKVTPKHSETIATKSHKSIIVAPTVSGDQIVTAWLNKSGNKPHYSNGEKLQVNVAANKDCNLMIFNYDGEQLTQLFPNEYQASPLVKAGQTIEVGGEGFKFDFTASNPTSKPSNEKIFVYAYPIESDNSPISVAMAPVPSSPFRAAEMTPEKYRELVNNSQAFFGRKVSVSAKKNEVEEVQLASYEEQSQAQGGAANKIELSLVIDGVRKVK